LSNIGNINCTGNTGSAKVIASGGTAPYSYFWNTIPVQTSAIANSLSSGIHTVIVTDSLGCSKSIDAIITQAILLTASIDTIINVSCFGGNNGVARLNVNGGKLPYTYLWNTLPVQTTAIANTLSAGSYNASVTDAAGCIQSVNVVISQPTELLANSSSLINASCFGANNGSATINAIGGTLPYTYLWNTLPIQTSAIAKNLTAGTYSVIVTDSAGCTQREGVVISQPIAISASISSSKNISCNGANTGSVTVSVNGLQLFMEHNTCSNNSNC
jgi:hypothetical protein